MRSRNTFPVNEERGRFVPAIRGPHISFHFCVTTRIGRSCDVPHEQIAGTASSTCRSVRGKPI